MFTYRSVRVADDLEAPGPITQAQREQEMEEMLEARDSYAAANAQLLLVVLLSLLFLGILPAGVVFMMSLLLVAMMTCARSAEHQRQAQREQAAAEAAAAAPQAGQFALPLVRLQRNAAGQPVLVMTHPRRMQELMALQSAVMGRAVPRPADLEVLLAMEEAAMRGQAAPAAPAAPPVSDAELAALPTAVHKGPPKTQRLASTDAGGSSGDAGGGDAAAPPPGGAPPPPQAEDDAGAMCSVCLDAYQDGDVLTTLPCLHRYHQKCINPWLQQSRTASCPMCKTPVFM